MHSGRVKIATHRRHDKFQYSSDAQLRTKTANHLIDIIKQDKQEQQHGHKQIEPIFTIDADVTNPIKHAAVATTIAPHKQ